MSYGTIYVFTDAVIDLANNFPEAKNTNSRASAIISPPRRHRRSDAEAEEGQRDLEHDGMRLFFT